MVITPVYNVETVEDFDEPPISTNCLYILYEQPAKK
jgi:hypothetical protein